jgi:hypothetical protein
MVYFAYVLTVIMYGLPFWGNAVNSNSIFMTQKRIIRAILNVSPKIFCHGLFRRMLPFYSQNMYSLLLLVLRNASKFLINKFSLV